MKSEFVTPKYESTLEAIILSANDVCATVLIIDSDEDGIYPITIADVDLPYEARVFREKHPHGDSMFKRGDIIQIKCQVKKDDCKPFPIEDIPTLFNSFYERESDNAELFEKIDQQAQQFTKEWLELCERDLMKKKGVS